MDKREIKQRTIKFRAWDGSKMHDVSAIYPLQSTAALGKIVCRVYDNITDQICYAEAIMQYTGLNDKNGVEIYEGDVIHIEQGQCVGHEQGYEDYRQIWKPITGPVVFDAGAFSFEGHEAGSLPLFSYIDEIEVIGNIFQPPIDKEPIK